MGGGKRREKKYVPCKICGKVFESEFAMPSHMIKHKREGKREQKTL